MAGSIFSMLIGLSVEFFLGGTSLGSDFGSSFRLGGIFTISLDELGGFIMFLVESFTAVFSVTGFGTSSNFLLVLVKLGTSISDFLLDSESFLRLSSPGFAIGFDFKLAKMSIEFAPDLVDDGSTLLFLFPNVITGLRTEEVGVNVCSMFHMESSSPFLILFSLLESSRLRLPPDVAAVSLTFLRRTTFIGSACLAFAPLEDCFEVLLSLLSISSSASDSLLLLFFFVLSTNDGSYSE